MLTRNNDWFNPDTLEVSYGIDVREKIGDKWEFYIESNKIRFYSEEDRLLKRKQLRKISYTCWKELEEIKKLNKQVSK